MTRICFGRLAVSGGVILLLSACGLFAPRSAENALVGTWANTIGTVWTFKTDGRFDVDLTHNGERDAWGKYDIAGDTITLTRSGGISPKGCDGKGVYRFARTGDALQFTLIQDDCKLRKKNVLLPWKRR
jgi:hypothetical protein